MINPIVITVDPARYGDDKSTIHVNGELIIERDDQSLLSLVSRVDRLVKDCIIIRVKGAGLGQGIIDALRDSGYQVVNVQHP